MSECSSSSEKKPACENELNSKSMSMVHFLPCSIEFDGPVAVNSFFQIKKSKNELRSAFRGRELVGKELKLPATVLGINAVQNRQTESTESSWDCVGQFDKINVWQHDIAPDLGQLQDCIDWFEIAEQVRSLVWNNTALQNASALRLSYQCGYM